jgi:hypothetical protein
VLKVALKLALKPCNISRFDARFSAQFGESLAAATGTTGAEKRGPETLLHKGSQMDPQHTTNLIIPRSDPRMVRNCGIRDRYSRIAEDAWAEFVKKSARLRPPAASTTKLPATRKQFYSL